MTPEWRDFLVAQGARVDSTIVTDFGAPAAELAATGAGDRVLADLSHLAALRFEGADAIAFLHGQLSCDVASLADGAARRGAYCTPQGRMLATFLIVRDGASIRMILTRSIAASIAKRLRMFVLRSKVTIVDETDTHRRLGIAGRGVDQTLALLGVAAAPADDRASNGWLRLAETRFIGSIGAADAARVWQTLAAQLRPVGTPCWEWLDVSAGMPFITAPTQDQLVPQMANLDLIGGVSFDKGCYPGQEIVARTRYLGRIKRRMVLANVAADPPPRPGDAVFGSDLGDQASGLVVSAAPSPHGGHDTLAVLQLSTIESGTAHLRSVAGPAFALRPLPYSIA